jgi:hypothetical protein
VASAAPGLDDPRWADVPTRPLVDARSGSALRMPTTTQVARWGSLLLVRFGATARSIRATMSRYKDKVWQEGAVEVYLRPPGSPRLYEFQVSPIGTTRDLVVHDPGGPAQRFDDSWSCEGLRTEARIRRDARGDASGWDAMFAIPLQSMAEAGAPGAAGSADAPGWRLGCFRLEYDPEEFGALLSDAGADAHADVFLVDLDEAAHKMNDTASAGAPVYTDSMRSERW